MEDNKKNSNQEYDDTQNDIYSAFNTNGDVSNSSNLENNLDSNEAKYQYKEKHYNNNYLEDHTVITRASRASKMILYGFYLLFVFVGVVVFFMLRADRYEFYLQKNEVNITSGSSYQVELTPKHIRYFDYLNYKYKIEDESIATVDEFGTIKAVGTGTTTLKISLWPGLTSKKMQINTNAINIQNIDLLVYKNNSLQKGKTVNMVSNQTITLKAIANSDTELFVDVEYSSSDKNIAMVDEFGNVTAKSEGTATIKGIRDGVTGEIVVTVKKKTSSGTTSTTPIAPKTIQSLVFTTNNIYLKKGNSTQLAVTINPKELSSSKLTWSSSNNKVVSVNANGIVTGVSAGEAIVTAKSSNGKTATCSVKVTEDTINVESVMLNTSNVTLDVGDNYQLIATINPSNATVRNITWSSTKPNVASVSNGIVTAKGEGTTTVTAKSSNGKLATATVKVNKKTSATPTPSVNVTKVDIGTSQVTKYVGESVSLSATIIPTNATAKSITWTSSNPGVATIDKNGQVKTIKKGTTIITVSADGITDTCTIIVREKEAPAITVPTGIQISASEVNLSQTSLTVNKGQTAAFTIKVKSSICSMHIESSSTAIATISSSNDDYNVNDGLAFFDSNGDGKETSIDFIIRGVKEGTAYINVNNLDCVRYSNDSSYTGSGKIGILVK